MTFISTFRKLYAPALLACAALYATSTPALAQDIDAKALLERIERLEAANTALQQKIEAIQQQTAVAVPAPALVPAAMAAAGAEPAAIASSAEKRADPVPYTGAGAGAPSKALGINPQYSYAMLDHAEGVNQRQIMLLEARRDGKLDSMVTLSGSVTAIANAHFSNRPNKFGYLMRHPTGNNQRTKKTQEITVASAQLALTVTPSSDISTYVEFLYDPEQSFGAGTLTALARNQVQVRKAYVMWGNLARSPLYVAAGKMDVPFGLQDTVSPYTNSTNWHAFAPLALGGQIGYHTDRVSLRAMAIVGGAQFRGANTPVDGTAIPSKVNNFSVDASYTAPIGANGKLRVGGSYLHGSAYCQGYPVFHFNPCADNAPAWAAYGQLDLKDLRLLGEFARTTKVWPGTKVPAPSNPLSIYDAARVTSFTLGARYNPSAILPNTDLSLEFSTFRAGDKGAPWERQNQWVLGLSHRLAPSVDLFGEVIRTEGYAPLNFISGGNFANGSTWSDADARSHILMLGVQAAF